MNVCAISPQANFNKTKATQTCHHSGCNSHNQRSAIKGMILCSACFCSGIFSGTQFLLCAKINFVRNVQYWKCIWMENWVTVQNPKSWFDEWRKNDNSRKRFAIKANRLIIYESNAILRGNLYVLYFWRRCSPRCTRPFVLANLGRKIYCMDSIRRWSTYKFSLRFRLYVISLHSLSIFIFLSNALLSVYFVVNASSAMGMCVCMYVSSLWSMSVRELFTYAQ